MLLVAGIALWALAHLSIALAAEQRARLIERLGEGPYKGLFSLTLVGALVLIVLGWKAFPSSSLYLPPAELRHLTMLLMPIALILFIAARPPNDIKHYLRHPQLTGVKLWALAHLLANGETRSVILFGGLLAWAVLEVIFINRRDPDWQRPPKVGLGRTAAVIAVGLAVTVGVMFAHPWIAGVAILPR